MRELAWALERAKTLKDVEQERKLNRAARDDWSSRVNSTLAFTQVYYGPDYYNRLYDLNTQLAEVFISSDFSDIRHYQEFEVSPQGEWIDLDIDLRKPHHEDGWTWNSGFIVSARTDAANHQWYAAMQIPLSAIDKRSPAAGSQFRMNLFVSEGPPGNHHAVTWQSPMSNTFHVPERFGVLRLVSEK